MTLTSTQTVQVTSTSTQSPKYSEPAEYSIVRNALAPCSIFTLLGVYVHSHSGDAISKADLIFSVGFLAYIFIANAVAFNSNKLQFSQMKRDKIHFEPMGKHSLGRGQFINKKSFLIYFGMAKILMFLIPMIMIFTSPSDVATMVAPSLLVVIAQVVAEQSTTCCHDVLRMMVPIGYSAYRIFGPLYLWAIDSYDLYLENAAKGDFVYSFNVGLAWVNLAFATYNLFGFLLLRALPLYFDKDETPRVEMAYTLLPFPKMNKIKM